MSLESIPVSRFMTKNVKTETEDLNIQAVCRTMNENNIGSIVVVSLGDKDQKPVERDIVRTIGQLNPSLLHTPIRELMSNLLSHYRLVVLPKMRYRPCSRKISDEFL